MNGIVENSLKFQALQRYKHRLERTIQVISVYRVRTVSELLIAMNKDLDKVNEQLKEESK